MNEALQFERLHKRMRHVCEALMLGNAGEADLLLYAVNKATPQDLVLRLFTNNITPAETDVTATYTEMSGQGYALKNLAGASWGAVVAGEPSTISYSAEQVWTFDGTGGTINVYGYFLTRVSSALFAWSELLPSPPFPVINSGDQIGITPKFGQS